MYVFFWLSPLYRKKNHSGQHPANFCAINNPFISNTFCQRRKATRITTWKNKRVNCKDVMKTAAVYSQIDYILCSEKIKHTPISARISSLTEASSDHCLVIWKMQVEKYTIFKNVSDRRTIIKLPE